MKIALVHNFYRQRGGEDAVVTRESGLLRSAGHEVVPFFRDSAEELGAAGFKQKLDLSLHLPFRRDVYGKFREFLQQENLGLVHVHNTFPLLSPSVLAAASALRLPVVLTFHNFRFICANGLFLREASPCEKCLHGSSLWGTIHGCYRESVAATLPLTRLARKYDKGRRLADWVTRFIALSPFSKEKFVEAGIPSSKIAVRSNFCEDPGEVPLWERREPFILFVGRLSEEKGILPLMDAARGFGITVKIAGSGPLESRIREAGLPKIELLGPKSPAEIRDLMRRARLLLIPSVCYENFPLVLAEAWANGLPVAVSRLGSLESLVQDGVTGLHFKPGDPESMAQVVRDAFAAPDLLRRIGEASRAAYERELSPLAARNSLEKIYSEAVETAKKGAAPREKC